MKKTLIRTVGKQILKLNLPTNEKMILMVLHMFSDGGRDRLTYEFIAERAGLLQWTTSLILHDLVVKGHIIVVPVEKKGTGYDHYSLSASFLSSLA